MSEFFSVKNFETFQHYKDRSPPWIKLYNELLDDYEFGRLPDASKMHLVAIWLLASRSNNRIPYDAQWVANRINATERVDLERLSQAGFIVKEQRCSEPLAPRKQYAIPETEGEQRESRAEQRQTRDASAPSSEDRYLPGRATALHRRVCEAYGMDPDAPSMGASRPVWLSAGTCRAWLEAGIPEDFALDVVREDAAKRSARGDGPPGSPAWLTPKIMDRLQAQRGTVERLKAAAAPPMPKTDDEWFGYCLMLLEDERWPEHLGLPPPDRRSQCPEKVWRRAQEQYRAA